MLQGRLLAIWRDQPGLPCGGHMARQPRSLPRIACRPSYHKPQLHSYDALAVPPQAVDFLGPAFAAFADKQYAVLTLPHDSREPGLMDTFARVAPQPGSLFPEVG